MLHCLPRLRSKRFCQGGDNEVSFVELSVLKTNGYNVLRGDQGQTIDIHSSSVGTITTRFCSGLSLGLRSSVCARRMVPIARHRVLRAETDCRGQAACRAKTTHRTQAPILIVYRLIARAKTTSQHVAQRSPTSAYAGRQEK
ncbi:hypothetical protein PsYK624_052030 [Phanerochaete sordida]|uniref:Uncharacterized protein n=1 Tax=Phanerochaete sordida TaxID=48140 RepID=A0A9P3LBE1_9APHY|nr:hypothetical protein PsYK624_052030 [Phanerochaete sordida]